MNEKQLREALDIACPGLLKKGAAARSKLDKIESAKPSVALGLARALAANPNALANLLMGALPGLASGNDAGYSLLAQRLGLLDPAAYDCHGRALKTVAPAVANAADGAGEDDQPILNAAQEAIGEMLWPIYWGCAQNGQAAEAAQDALLAHQLAAALAAGVDPNSRMLLREGLDAPLLSACLLAQAWESARVLLLAGADPNGPTAGDSPNIPPLYFALRCRGPEASSVAAHMVKLGADPRVGAPGSFAFDCQDFPEQVEARQGELFKWMIFLGHAEPLHAALLGSGNTKDWPRTLAKTLESMGWHPSEAGRLTSAIELIEFSEFAQPSGDEPAAKRRGQRI